MQLDTTTPTGKLILQLMGCFAEFERDVMLERQREGVAKQRPRASTRDGSRRHSGSLPKWFSCEGRG
jgi:DNA invertase Pin-like site-specific DNA recombinase